MDLIITKKKTRAKRPKDPQTNDLIFSIPSVNLSFYCILKKYKDITTPVCQFDEPQFKGKLSYFTMLKKLKKHMPLINPLMTLRKYLNILKGKAFALCQQRKRNHYIIPMNNTNESMPIVYFKPQLALVNTSRTCQNITCKIA